MLWSQYKLATIRCTEFLRREITKILNIANRNSDFLTLQTLEFQKTIPTGIFGIKNKLELCLQWGSQKLESKIGIPNQVIRKWNHVLSGNRIPFRSVSETKFCFGMTRKRISISWYFCVCTYSRTMVEVETKSLSKTSCYIIISLCCSLKNIMVS